jgi:methylmalonyl-CoA mutase
LHRQKIRDELRRDIEFFSPRSGSHPIIAAADAVGSARPAWHSCTMTRGSADDLALGAEFPAATQEQWRKLVEDALKGASFEDSLVSKTYDGIRIEPLSPRKPQAAPVVRRTHGTPWKVMQRIDNPQSSCANAQAKEDLANGATGLVLVFAGGRGAYGYGLAPESEAIARALNDIDLGSGIAIELDPGRDASAAVMSLITSLQERGTQPALANVRFGLDPIGTAVLAGDAPVSWAGIAGELSGMIADLADRGFRGPFVTADGTLVHNAGGSEAQELGYALAVAVAYLRALETAGISLDTARRMIYFRLTADADQFLSIAKFRALRRLWGRIEESCGLNPAPIFIAAETAWRMMTKRDPHVNMVRTTIAVMAAGVGGADAITALPFTMAIGLPDRFARRVARNTQLVLLEESNLARVPDPAAGSGAMEDLTDKLCHAAWRQLQDIEKSGGAWRVLQGGEMQRDIAAVRAQRQSAVATRRDTLVGVTEFAHLTEVPVAVADVAPVRRVAYSPEHPFEALAPIRLAEPFEQLRDMSDRMLARTGARPKIFLAALGSISDFGPRATFARDFFQVGGIEALSNNEVGERTEMVTAFARSGARLVCLCSSDEIYAREGAEAVQALCNAGASVWVAGRPGKLKAELERAGICGFIFEGCDVPAMLRKAYDRMAA